MISIEGLTFAYEPNALIFQDFNWSVARRAAWAVLGPSGCGKSTLLN
ncbi:MAG: ATP-binding cassette domain-containing protein, partial [Bellilinea sp.]